MQLRYLTTAEAAKMLGVSVRTLEQFRSDGGGPRCVYVRMPSGRSSPRYRTDDLEAWAEGGEQRGA